MMDEINMIIELSCPIFKYEYNTIYMPIEIAYIIFTKNEIKEVYSSRIKYDLTKYPKQYWIDLFHLYVSKFPAVFRTHLFYEIYNLDQYSISEDYKNKIDQHNVEVFYKDNYGLDSNILKKTLINKIKKYNIKVYAKNTTRINHFLDVSHNRINTYDLKKLGILKYSDILPTTKSKYLNKFDTKPININYGIFEKNILFKRKLINELLTADIPIFKVIVFYGIFKSRKLFSYNYS